MVYLGVRRRGGGVGLVREGDFDLTESGRAITSRSR